MRRYLTSIVGAVLMIALAPAGASAQAGRIEGTVTDAETKEPLAGANVVVEGTTLRATTGADGSYVITPVPAGEYTLIASMKGYKKLTKSVRVRPGETTTVNFELEETIFELEKVVVTATRTETPVKDLPASVSVITEDDIEKIHTKTLDDVLNIIPGVSPERYKGFGTTTGHMGVCMRGTGHASRTLVLKDGVPLNDLHYGTVDLWNTLSSCNVERIEVVRGAASALYGSSAMGGVINIISRPPRKRARAGLRFEYGSRGTLIASGNYSKVFFDRLGLSISAEKKRSEGYKYYEAERWKDYYKETTTDLLNAALRVDWRLKEGSILKLELERNEEKPVVTTSTRYEIQNIIDRVTLGYRGSAGKTMYKATAWAYKRDASTTALKYNKSTKAHDKPYYTSDIPSDGWGFMGQVSRTIKGHSLTFGADLQGAKVETSYDYAGKGLRFYTGKVSLYSIFVHDEISLLKGKVVLSLGARYDWWKHTKGRFIDETTGKLIEIDYPERGNSAFSPKAGIVYRPREEIRFRVSFGTGFKAPGIYYLYRSGPHGPRKFDVGNPDLKPERMTHSIDIGFDIRPIEELQATFTYYNSSFKDFIYKKTLSEEEIPPYFHPEPGQEVIQPVNVGRVDIHGYEAGIKVDLHPHWSIFANYTYNRSIIKEHELAPELEGKKLRKTPEYRFNFGLTYDNPKLFRATATFRNVGPRFYDEKNEKRLEGYSVWDLKISRVLFGGLELSLSVDNLTDEKYKMSWYYLAPPRTIMVGLTYKY